MLRGSRYVKQDEIRFEPRLATRLEEKKARRLHDDLRIRLTYHSNAIEGNTLSLRETQVIIEEGIAIGGHTLREHLEATNHARAFDELRHFVEMSATITIETVHRFHALVLRDGYAPAFLLREWKLRYLEALHAADAGEYRQIVNLIGQAVEAGLDFYLDACAAIPNEQYQLLTDLALSSGYDVNYLGLLARSGKLEARKWNRGWYATPAALARYEQEAQAEPRGRPGGHRRPKKLPPFS